MEFLSDRLLGRAVQQRAEYQESATQSVVNTVYDAAGRAVSVYVPESESFTWEFSRPSGWNTRPRTQTVYDALGRTTVVTATDNTVTRLFYQGRDTMVLDAANRQRFSRVDAYGQLILVREYQGTYTSPNWNASIYATTRYAYDPLGNLLTVTDALNNVTMMSYDKLSRKTAMNDPDMGAWSYQYDAAGNLMQQTDARGCVTTYTYDGLDRPTGKTYSGACSGTTAVTYTYDAFSSGTNYGRGYRTGMTDGSGSTTWTYDPRGRVKQETKVINGGGTFKTEWGYDSLDRVTWMKYPSGNTGGLGEQVNYTYAANGALNSVAGTNPYVQSTAYDAAGRVTQRALGNPAVLYTTYAYYPWTTANGQGRLQTLKTGTGVPPNNTSLQQLQYTYDAVGNVLTIADYNAGGTQTQTFTYDALDRLQTAAAAGGTGGTYTTKTYSYNQIGNLTNNGSGTLTYGTQSPAPTCPAGALTKPHAVVSGNGNTYCYDANGNQVKRILGANTSTLTYDAENRLTAVSGATSASFVYDGDGNRVKSVMGGVTTYYVGAHFEWTGSTSTMVKYYYAGGQRVAMRQGNPGTVYFLLGDHLGSTSLTVNSSGSKVAELRYHPWGGTRYTYGTTPTTRRFTGQIEDAAIGLYFYNARYYDSALGRFIQADTIVPSPANPQSLNRYSYVLNSPLNYIDPSGHREVRYTEGERITQEVFSEYAGEWDIAKQARNRAIIETIFSVADTVAAILWEPYDWISTGARCTQGECNALDYAGFLPLIPGALGRVDDVARAADKIDDTTDALRSGDNVLELPLPKKPSSPGRMQLEVNRGQAPRGIERVDAAHNPSVPNQEPHVHFCDGTSCNQSGTIHDKRRGVPNITKEIAEWLTNHGWTPYKGD